MLILVLPPGLLLLLPGLLTLWLGRLVLFPGRLVVCFMLDVGLFVDTLGRVVVGLFTVGFVVAGLVVGFCTGLEVLGKFLVVVLVWPPLMVGRDVVGRATLGFALLLGAVLGMDRPPPVGRWFNLWANTLLGRLNAKSNIKELAYSFMEEKVLIDGFIIKRL